MKILACLVIGAVVGTAFGGRQALRCARNHVFAKAARWLQVSAVAAAFASAIACSLILGWPWRSIESSTPEEVSRTVMETVEEVSQVPYWWFFKRNVTVAHEEPKEVTAIVMRATTVTVFDPLLVPVVLVVAGASSGLELAAIRLIWWARS